MGTDCHFCIKRKNGNKNIRIWYIYQYIMPVQYSTVGACTCFYQKVLDIIFWYVSSLGLGVLLLKEDLRKYVLPQNKAPKGIKLPLLLL